MEFDVADPSTVSEEHEGDPVGHVVLGIKFEKKTIGAK